MGKEIKTRQIKKDIKALDKTAVAAQHIRQVYVHTKDSVKQGQTSENDSPVEYAENKIRETSERTVQGAVYQAGRIGKQALKSRKKKESIVGEECISSQVSDGESGTMSENISSVFSEGSGADHCQTKENLQKQVQLQKMEKSRSNRSAYKYSEQAKQTVKQSTRQTEQSIKTTGKGTVKYAGRTVKTTEQSTHAAIKTTQETARSAQAAARASAKMAEKSLRTARQISRQAVKTAHQTAKATARAVSTAVKAIVASTKELITAIAAGGWISVFILIVVILFGGVLCMVGGDNSSSVSPVSAEVEAYTPLIRQYTNQCGIGEYVELIKAVMMQESGGQGSDPMRSSESSFNTRYPREPNGITDPEYSIACGVQEIKAVLMSAEVESPVDMDRIKLALQGYNFGNGYIAWAKENYGGYTVANAAEFSDLMAQRMGWTGYGDKQYVPHVLRYYVFGRIPTGAGNQAIVQIALSQEGNAGDTYWSWYGFNSRVEWCACFVSWCADQCGYIESGVIPKFSACSGGVAWFESRGQFRDGSYVPVAGDIIFFDWGNDGSINHVGIVENVIDGRVHTIEGNSGNKCAKRSYAIGDNRIYGYGTPAY